MNPFYRILAWICVLMIGLAGCTGPATIQPTVIPPTSQPAPLPAATLTPLPLKATSTPAASGPAGAPAAPNLSLVRAQVVALTQSSSRAVLRLKIIGSEPKAGYLDFGARVVGQEIDAFWTDANPPALSAGQAITAELRYQGDEKGGNYLISAVAPANPVKAVPPSPDLIENLREQGYSSAEILGLTRTPIEVDLNSSAVVPVVGTRKALVLLVSFQDVKLNAVSQPALYNDLLFSKGTYPAPGSMRDFYLANSYGLLDVQGNTADSVTAPHNADYYAKYDGVHDKGMGPYPNNAQGLVSDAVLAADAFINFADYAVYGVVQDLFVVHAGASAETNYPSDLIWSHQGYLPEPLVVDGVQVRKYSIEPEYVYMPGDSTMGVFTHEYGHVLGLPDLYDTDTPVDSLGVGAWSLMAMGSWNGPRGSSPANLDPWSKIRLGWINPTVPTQAANGVILPPSNSSPVAYKLRMSKDSNEYFLLENRQLVGFDAALPGSGLLIWHIDDDAWSNTQQCPQNNNWLCGAAHYHVALEQADGLYHLENNLNGGDANDPFPGLGGNSTFNFVTTPNSSSYSFSDDTLIRVINIAAAGTDMTFDFSIPSIPTVINDDFGAATLINALPYTQTESATWATVAPDDPIFSCAFTPPTHTVWYRYTPTKSGMLLLDTVMSDYNTILGVWTGTRGHLTAAGCNDDFNGIQSSLRVPVQAGTTYYIGVGRNPSMGVMPESLVAYEDGDRVVDAPLMLKLSASFTHLGFLPVLQR